MQLHVYQDRVLEICNSTQITVEYWKYAIAYRSQKSTGNMQQHTEHGRALEICNSLQITVEYWKYAIAYRSW